MKITTYLLLAFGLFFIGNQATALEIHMVPLEIVSSTDKEVHFPNLLMDLPTTVDAYDPMNSIQISPLVEAPTVRSLIDAGSYSMSNSLDYLLYGSIQITSRWCEVRLSLYEYETDSIRTAFYSKLDADRSSDLADELGRKIANYIYREFGISQRMLIENSPGYVELSMTPGYWGIFSESWNDLIIGYFNIGISAAIALPQPRFVFNGNELYPRFGLSIDYSFGKSKTGVEPFTYNSFQISLPLELTLDLKRYHRFNLIVSPGYQIDYLLQSRKYSDVYNDISGNFLLKTGFSYMFTPEESNFSFGIVNMFDLSFYNELMISYKPSIKISYKIHEFGDTSNE